MRPYRSEKVDIAVEGRSMGAFVATPQGDGPFAAVLVFQEVFGVNMHIRDVAQRLATEGYVAIAPDSYHRVAPGIERAYTPAAMSGARELIGSVTVAALDADVAATIAYLRARPDVRADRIGAIGFCMGGHVAYLAAATHDLTATASFYGGRIATSGPGAESVLPTVTRTGGIKGTMLCLFGGQDQHIGAEQVATIEAALKTHHVRHEVVTYPEADHGFFCDWRGSYHEPSAQDAWERTKKLFASTLKI